MGRTPDWPPSSPATGSTSNRAIPTAKHRLPTRTCVACRLEAGKADLIRIVRTPEGGVEVDRQGRLPGRGAYIHPSSDCVEVAQKRRALDRALGTPVPPEVWSQLSGASGSSPSP